MVSSWKRQKKKGGNLVIRNVRSRVRKQSRIVHVISAKGYTYIVYTYTQAQYLICHVCVCLALLTILYNQWIPQGEPLVPDGEWGPLCNYPCLLFIYFNGEPRYADFMIHLYYIRWLFLEQGNFNACVLIDSHTRARARASFFRTRRISHS